MKKRDLFERAIEGLGRIIPDLDTALVVADELVQRIYMVRADPIPLPFKKSLCLFKDLCVGFFFCHA